MTRFRDELKVIPAPAWIIAFAVYAGFALALLMFAIPSDREMSRWPTGGAVVFSLGIPVIVFVLALLIGYVNGDAKRRGMRAGLWTLAAIFVPNVIGIILYFFVREPLTTCSHCHAQVRSIFPFCPNCGTALRVACPACRQAVESGWKNCAHCGTALSGVPSAPATAVNR